MTEHAEALAKLEAEIQARNCLDETSKARFLELAKRIDLLRGALVAFDRFHTAEAALAADNALDSGNTKPAELLHEQMTKRAILYKARAEAAEARNAELEEQLEEKRDIDKQGGGGMSDLKVNWDKWREKQSEESWEIVLQGQRLAKAALNPKVTRAELAAMANDLLYFIDYGTVRSGAADRRDGDE